MSTLSMADGGMEGKGKKVTGGYGVLEKSMMDGSEANWVDVRTKMRYKPLALPSW
jgi:hypothetical protein